MLKNCQNYTLVFGNFSAFFLSSPLRNYEKKSCLNKLKFWEASRNQKIFYDSIFQKMYVHNWIYKKEYIMLLFFNKMYVCHVNDYMIETLMKKPNKTTKKRISKHYCCLSLKSIFFQKKTFDVFFFFFLTISYLYFNVMTWLGRSTVYLIL